MANNPLFRPTNSPTQTTKPTKAVNKVGTHVRLTHNTFDNSFFNFKTQRYGKYEPFWWKPVVAGDNEPFSNSHNVRSLPFASPILSPMKLNKDYFQVPMYAIQPNTWDYIFKSPSQGDDVPFDVQNLFPLQFGDSRDDSFLDICCIWLTDTLAIFFEKANGVDFDGNITLSQASFGENIVLTLLLLENFFSTGSLLYNLGFKFNPVLFDSDGVAYSFDEIFDLAFRSMELAFLLNIPDPDSPTSFSRKFFTTSQSVSSDFTIFSSIDNDFISPEDSTEVLKVDMFTALSLLRSHYSHIVAINVISSPATIPSSYKYGFSVVDEELPEGFTSSLNCIRMDVINAYQLACAQYYVNPRVDFLYNAQLYRDNFIQLLREAYQFYNNNIPIIVASFDYNGLPVLYDYLSFHYYTYLQSMIYDHLTGNLDTGSTGSNIEVLHYVATLVDYLFGYREQLRFGNYFTDSRTQALGYGEQGSDVVTVMNGAVSVTDMSQKLVLERFRGAVAHLDNTAEDYLMSMFHEQLPPDYHYPKFIAHSEFAINGEEVSNTTSDDQGNIVTNLKSGQDTAEFNIKISVPSILIGISYVSIPELYCQIKERHYFHADRYDMFQPMLQYFGDQEIYNREVSDYIPNPQDSYGYVSRNGEYKQRLSQVSGAFVHSLRSWVFTVDLPEFAKESQFPRLVNTQSPLAIRTYDFEFNRFLRSQTGLSLGTGFHFILQYNNKNVDNRPMDVNPLPLYPNQTL